MLLSEFFDLSFSVSDTIVNFTFWTFSRYVVLFKEFSLFFKSVNLSLKICILVFQSFHAFNFLEYIVLCAVL